MSPDGRWLLVVTTEDDGDVGKATKLPHYVTESGYQEAEEGRPLVGRNAPLPHALWLVDVAAAKARKLSFASLPGIGTDPLAALHCDFVMPHIHAREQRRFRPVPAIFAG